MVSLSNPHEPLRPLRFAAGGRSILAHMGKLRDASPGEIEQTLDQSSGISHAVVRSCAEVRWRLKRRRSTQGWSLRSCDWRDRI